MSDSSDNKALALELAALIVAAAEEADDIRYYSGGPKRNISKEALAEKVMQSSKVILAALSTRTPTTDGVTDDKVAVTQEALERAGDLFEAEAWPDDMTLAERHQMAFARYIMAQDQARLAGERAERERCAAICDAMERDPNVPQEARSAAWNLAIALRAGPMPSPPAIRDVCPDHRLDDGGSMSSEIELAKLLQKQLQDALPGAEVTSEVGRRTNHWAIATNFELKLPDGRYVDVYVSLAPFQTHAPRGSISWGS